MGAGGVPNKGVEVTYARKLPPLFKPNSRYDRLDKNGKRVQSRWYDKEGKAIRNRDYNERGKIPSPHDHTWTWKGEEGKRGEEHLPPDYNLTNQLDKENYERAN